MNERRIPGPSGWKGFAVNLGLLALGALLFALSFPSFLSDWGWAPLAWVSLVPVFLLVRRVRWWASPLWGAAYGYVAYTLFNFWLASFNPVSFILVPVIYAGWFFLLFPLLVLADRAFPRYGWLAQLVLWAAFEVVRTKGFLGYSYGVIGYTQYGWRSLISIADIFGVVGVSVLVAFPSILGAWWLSDRIIGNAAWRSALKRPGRRWAAPALAWAGLMLAANAYGLATRVDYSGAPTWRVALVQHNVNAWLAGLQAYRDSLDSLERTTREALAQHPDAVVWSETAFVPAIEWHEKYRQERGKVELVQDLREFLGPLDIPVIIGNNDSFMDAGARVDYNAVLLFDRGEIVDRYHKIHLVPFGEHFPYAKTFPRLMEYIQSYGTPLYRAGTEYTVFDLAKWGGPKVSPLICFEDTFGDLSRNFVRAGAEVLVNVTNDAWSPQPACAIQHLAMAVFRSVEERRTLVRATTGGLTAVIDPNGKIIAKMEPFVRGALVADAPVWTGRTTPYTRFGAWFDVLMVVLGALSAVLGCALLAIRASRRGR